jgi:diacylglycerol diphosphate phosphatase / phosphatidate phosphatase
MPLSPESKIVTSLLLDYVLCFGCCVLAFAIERIPPAQRVAFFGDLSINYPFEKNSTIPGWTLPLVSFVVPSVFVFLIGSFRKRSARYHAVAILGLLLGVTVTYVLTSVLKVSMGKLRPDFKERCKPREIPGGNNFGKILECTGDKAIITEGRKSFPSGHTSTSFAGFGYSSLYIAYQLRLFTQQSYVLKSIFFVLPWIIATMIASTRVFDNKHHYSDVIGGMLIGVLFAFVSFFLYLPVLRKLGMEQAGENDIILPSLPRNSQTGDLHISKHQTSNNSV